MMRISLREDVDSGLFDGDNAVDDMSSSGVLACRRHRPCWEASLS